MNEPEIVPILVDTDIGVDIDDDLAILTLLGIIKQQNYTKQNKQIKICAMTTCGFLPSLKTIQCKKLLQLVQQEHIPVYKGCGRTLTNRSYVPFKVTNIIFSIYNVCNYILAALHCRYCRTSNRKKEKMKAENIKDAVHAMVYFAKRYEHTNHKLTIIGIGPLTNIAQAMKKDVDFLHRIQSINIMGGLIGDMRDSRLLKVDCKHGGRDSVAMIITHKHDTNIRSDKAAFSYLLETAKKDKMLHKLLLVPADMTLRIFINEQDREDIFRWINKYCQCKTNKDSGFIVKYLKHSLKVWPCCQALILKSDSENCKSYLHDPLTVVTALVSDAIIEGDADLDFELETSKIEYIKQEDTQQSTLSQSKLASLAVSWFMEDDSCRCLVNYNADKMKQYILECIKNMLVDDPRFYIKNKPTISMHVVRPDKPQVAISQIRITR
eukprot:72129_1